MNRQDAMQVLELAQNFTEDDVKRKFRSLAMKYHPDKPGGSKAMFEKLNAARNLLSNSTKPSDNDLVSFTFMGVNRTMSRSEFERFKASVEKIKSDMEEMSAGLGGMSERLEAIRYKDSVAFFNFSMTSLFIVLTFLFGQYVIAPIFHIFHGLSIYIGLKILTFYIGFSVWRTLVPIWGELYFGSKIYRKYNGIKIFK